MLILQPLSLSRVLQGFAPWPGRGLWDATAFGVPQRQSKLDCLPVHPTVPEEKPLGRWLNRAGFGLLAADQQALVSLVSFRLFGHMDLLQEAQLSFTVSIPSKWPLLGLRSQHLWTAVGKLTEGKPCPLTVMAVKVFLEERPFQSKLLATMH